MRVDLTMAEAQAIGLCWLARARGLPPVHNLRVAVVTMHPDICGWCDYPMPELLTMLGAFKAIVSLTDYQRWQALPARAKGEAIRLAQGVSDAA